ncbi:MAG: PD-(D/E)XK nuclease-like domain-containing protein, partial [Planctomycetota bacterium]
EHADLLAMRASVFANPVAAFLLEGCQHEVGFRSPSGYGPFQIQCRADVFKPDGLSDLKTIGDMDDLHSSITGFGYYRQAALYRHIVHTACGRWLPFNFIVVEKAAPLYRCRVVELDDDYLALGWQEIESALIEIGQRTEANDWADHRDAEQLAPPNWLRERAMRMAA